MFILLINHLWATEKKSDEIVLKEITVEKSAEEGCSKVEIEQYAVQQAIYFYETVGVWAGVFTIESVLKTRVEFVDSEYFKLHMGYVYTPVPRNKYRRVDVGTDQRIFNFVCTDHWVLDRMGDHMSAEFSD